MALRLSSRAITRPVSLSRHFHNTPRASLPYKDSQDPQTLSPRSNEYTRSGTDDQVAALDEAPYRRNKNKPEDELDAAGHETTSQANPLEVSGANKDMSADTMNMKVKHEEREVRSRHGSTQGKGDRLYKSSSWKKTKVQL